ncbi:uncharacterized protein LOC110831288 isoform X2 [Zootermopsis nevadensis]|uniref:uncharacterized protein LOC110831288 isoform X2 n=1 Tax=Zootermopsis nevadensis TaxID=136037 RepID=UPI000B8E9448|nr:uncharacterized protein LOC110831288 isoform X2 [Zootermopsis nevadensis]
MNKFIRCIKSKIKRDNEGPDKVGACSRQLRQLHITDLPPEVLALIFEHCSYDVLGRQVRLVCKRFCDVATSVLNCGFSTLGPKIDRAMADAVSLFEEGRTLEELLYRLLRAATGRYIYSPYSGSGHLACFYAGSLLDEFLRFLRVACHSPTLLGSAMLNPDFGNEVYKLCVRCSIFMNHFKKRTEKFERDYSISGAKLIDLYCGLMKRHVRMTPHEQAVTVNGTECHIEANYRMPYTWFNCLPSSNAQPNQWSEEPRSIYLRTRQLINDRNHFFLEKIHHEKELLIRKVPYILTLKYIIPSLYNAFHQNYGYLFFYGTMDRSTYDHNSHVERSPTVQLFHYFNLDFFTSRNESDKSDGVVNVPQSSNMDLNIDMELHSRLRLAPIRFSDNSLAYIWPSAVIVGGYRQIRFK